MSGKKQQCIHHYIPHCARHQTWEYIIKCLGAWLLSCARCAPCTFRTRTWPNDKNLTYNYRTPMHAILFANSTRPSVSSRFGVDVLNRELNKLSDIVIIGLGCVTIFYFLKPVSFLWVFRNLGGGEGARWAHRSGWIAPGGCRDTIQPQAVAERKSLMLIMFDKDPIFLKRFNLNVF